MTVPHFALTCLICSGRGFVRWLPPVPPVRLEQEPPTEPQPLQVEQRVCTDCDGTGTMLLRNRPHG